MPRSLARAGDGVERLPRVHRAPHHGDPGPRVDPAVQQRRHVHDHPAQRVHQVGGEMRPGGVPAGPGEPDVDRVGGRRERPGADPDQAGRQLRETVQRVDRRDVLERARRDHVRGARTGWTPRRAGRSAGSGRAARRARPAGRGPGRARAGWSCARHGRRRGPPRRRSTGTARPCCPATAARRGRPGTRSPGRPRRCRRSPRCPWAAVAGRGRPPPARGRPGRRSRTRGVSAPGEREYADEWLPAPRLARRASGRAGRAGARRRAAARATPDWASPGGSVRAVVTSVSVSLSKFCRVSATRDSLDPFW